MTRIYHVKISICFIAAAFLWLIIFVVKPFNFWLSMCCGVLLLLSTAFVFDRSLFRLGKLKPAHLVIGITAAAVLYAIFYIGNILSAYIIPMKDAQISSVYLNRSGTSSFLIAAALLFVIGPGEEIFWRGFIQKTIAGNYGIKSIVISAILYAAVHVFTMNFMLIMASLICGFFWGALYYQQKSLYPVIISHALWDVAVFLLFPFS